MDADTVARNQSNAAAVPYSAGAYPGSSSLVTADTVRQYRDTVSGYETDDPTVGRRPPAPPTLRKQETALYDESDDDDETLEATEQTMRNHRLNDSRDGATASADYSTVTNGIEVEMSEREMQAFLAFQQQQQQQTEVIGEQAVIQQKQQQQPGAKSYTNDEQYERKKAARHTYMVRQANTLLIDNSIDEQRAAANGNQAQTVTSEMNHDEMMERLYEKHRTKGFLEKTGAALGAVVRKINSTLTPGASIEEIERVRSKMLSANAVTATVAPHMVGGVSSSTSALNNSAELAQATQLDLREHLHCDTVAEALQRKIDLKLLAKCRQMSADQLRREGLSCAKLQQFGLSLRDVVHTLGIPWTDLYQKLHFNHTLLTRESRWFDVQTLARCLAAVPDADLVHDLNFSISDIFRLRCGDFEVSQLQFDMDRLFRMGLTKREFLSLPWYPQTMINLLGLEKRHLTDELGLTKNDYHYLVRQRRWTAELLRTELEFSEHELAQLGLSMVMCNEDRVPLQPSRPDDPSYDTVHETAFASGLSNVASAPVPRHQRQYPPQHRAPLTYGEIFGARGHSDRSEHNRRHAASTIESTRHSIAQISIDRPYQEDPPLPVSREEHSDDDEDATTAPPLQLRFV